MRRAIFFVITIAVLTPLIAPFLKPGRAWTYDVDYHVYRMAAFHNAVLEGQIPPRWSSQLVYGWGSPLFSFNWSLPYWMGEPFLFAGFSLTDASKAVVILSVIFSYLCMFLFLREWMGFWPALGGAVIYEWSLFRIYLLFTGGGLGMHAAFIFWPILFWGVLKNKKPVWSFVCISAGTALLMLSHQVMFLIIQPLWWIFARKRLSIALPAFIAGLGLSAYFWLPAFLEQQFINIGITELLYKTHFLDLETIFYQPGISNFNPSLRFWYWSTGWNLFTIVLASGVLLVRDRKHQVMRLFAAFFLLGQFLMTEASKPLWEIVPLLSSFQYPVRFQALSLFCASVLAAYLISKVRSGGWIVSIAVIILTAVVHSMAIPKDWPRQVIPDSYYYESESTADMMGEYLPVWADIDYFFSASRFERYPIARIIEGKGTIEDMTKRSSEVFFTVNAQSPVFLVINQFYFPGWRVEANSRVVPAETYGAGEMLIELPSGTSSVTARFTDTPIRTAGNLTTFGTFMGMILFGVNRLWNKRLRVI